MEEQTGNSTQTMVQFRMASSIVNNAIRLVRGGIENTTHGVLRVLNVGCKKTVPKVTNELLLQPAVKLAAKIRRGEVSPFLIFNSVKICFKFTFQLLEE